VGFSRIFFLFFYDKNFSKFFGHGVTNFWSPRDQFWSRRDQNDFGHEAARPPEGWHKLIVAQCKKRVF